MFQVEILYCESSEALAQDAQGSCGCPIPEGMENPGGWDFEQPGLLVVSLSMTVELDDH